MAAGGGGRGKWQSSASINSWVVATLCLRSIDPERKRSVDRDPRRVLASLMVLNVKQLLMLKREVASIEDDLDATGFLGIENEDEGCRSSIGSDFDLTSAWAGRASPSLSSSSSSTSSSFQKTGSSGSSLPGRYMLNCSGRKECVRRNGEIRPDCTFLKSDGAPIVGRREVLRLFLKLIPLRDLGLDSRERLPTSHAGCRLGISVGRAVEGPEGRHDV